MSDFQECDNAHIELMRQLEDVAKKLDTAEYRYLASKHRADAEEDKQYLTLKTKAPPKTTDSQLKAEARQKSYIHTARSIVKQSQFKRLKRLYEIIERKDTFNNIKASNAKSEANRFGR